MKNIDIKSLGIGLALGLIAALTIAAAGKETPRQVEPVSYEYKVVYIKYDHGNSKSVEERINNTATEGWRFLEAIDSQAIFERPISD